MEDTQFAEPTRDECTIAALAHILQVITWWMGPLIIYLHEGMFLLARPEAS